MFYNEEERRNEGNYGFECSASDNGAIISNDGLGGFVNGSCVSDGRKSDEEIVPSNVYFHDVYNNTMVSNNGEIFNYDATNDQYVPASYQEYHDYGSQLISGDGCVVPNRRIPSFNSSNDGSYVMDIDMSRTGAIKVSREVVKVEDKKMSDYNKGLVVGAGSVMLIFAALYLLNHFGIYSIQNDPLIKAIVDLLSTIF